MKKSIITAAILAASMGSFAGSASAAITLSYVQDSGFVFNSVTPTIGGIGVDGLQPAIAPDPRYQSLWWGDDNPSRGFTAAQQTGSPDGSPGATPITTVIDSTTNFVTSAAANAWTTSTGGNGDPDSALKVVSLAGSITSGAGFVPLSHVFHSNQTIQQDNSNVLTSGIIRSLLNIGGFDTPVNDVAFSFNETLNSDPDYFCPDGSGESCDVFQFSKAGFGSVFLPIGGKLYELSFALMGVSEDAFIVNSGYGCQIGNFCVLTKEDNVNWLTVGMQLNEVPEPGSLALMGLGLFGVGAALRRRKNRS